MRNGETVGFWEARRTATSCASARAILSSLALGIRRRRKLVGVPVMGLDDLTGDVDRGVFFFPRDETYCGVEFGQYSFVDI